ncbi:MAG: NAD(P)(+) transhydrogenase (Re/Si-specific) subunit beta [Acetobacter sp.]|nr:NAD(P)(+) transhydrogenase (Re/Si-specific) subunit beta [Acetobacter sp.]
MINTLIALIYSMFILAINGLSTPQKAYRGNILAMLAMGLAIVWGLYNLSYQYLLPTTLALFGGALIGIISAHKISMPNLPQMIALLNGLGGLAAGLIGITEITNIEYHPLLILVIISIGFITFTGSIAAFLKLSGKRLFIDNDTLRAISLIILITTVISGFYAYNNSGEYLWSFIALLCLWGLLFILPIGGADMPIIISVLNSFSGWSTVLVGFSLNNTLLIIVGTLIGASGTILSYIMTKAMNRSLAKVIFSPPQTTSDDISNENKTIHQGSPQDAAFLMENANKVIIVPGYGMAAAGAQHELANMSKVLKTKYNVEVKFAIHPVAGRMPGHMNVLLAEADITPDDVFELKDINQEFQTADVAYVIGANDTTNPLAKTKIDSPIYQMPILEVEQAKKILFVKRSLAAGYSGIDNPLFYADNTLMLLGDAKEVTKQIVANLEE